jgi:hypothetical protein
MASRELHSPCTPPHNQPRRWPAGLVLQDGRRQCTAKRPSNLGTQGRAGHPEPPSHPDSIGPAGEASTAVVEPERDRPSNEQARRGTFDHEQQPKVLAEPSVDRVVVRKPLI